MFRVLLGYGFHSFGVKLNSFAKLDSRDEIDLTRSTAAGQIVKMG